MAESSAAREGLEEAASMNDIIDLNVGGTRCDSLPNRVESLKPCRRFQTTRQSLLHDPNSMLARMFDPVSPLSPGLLLTVESQKGLSENIH